MKDTLSCFRKRIRALQEHGHQTSLHLRHAYKTGTPLFLDQIEHLQLNFQPVLKIPTSSPRPLTPCKMMNSFDFIVFIVWLLLLLMLYFLFRICFLLYFICIYASCELQILGLLFILLDSTLSTVVI